MKKRNKPLYFKQNSKLRSVKSYPSQQKNHNKSRKNLILLNKLLKLKYKNHLSITNNKGNPK